MDALVRGTTPTIIFRFDEISTATIAVAILSVKQNGVAKITKDLSTATQQQKSLSWQLSQADTLGLSALYPAEIICDWRLQSGVRGMSVPTTVNVENSGKGEVI